MCQRKGNALQTACILAALMLLLGGFLFGCGGPTQFVAGEMTSPPAGCAAARERGHEC